MQCVPLVQQISWKKVKESVLPRTSGWTKMESFLDKLVDILLLFYECQLGKLDFLYTLWSSGWLEKSNGSCDNCKNDLKPLEIQQEGGSLKGSILDGIYHGSCALGAGKSFAGYLPSSWKKRLIYGVAWLDGWTDVRQILWGVANPRCISHVKRNWRQKSLPDRCSPVSGKEWNCRAVTPGHAVLGQPLFDAVLKASSGAQYDI